MFKTKPHNTILSLTHLRSIQQICPQFPSVLLNTLPVIFHANLIVPCCRRRREFAYSFAYGMRSFGQQQAFGQGRSMCGWNKKKSYSTKWWFYIRRLKRMWQNFHSYALKPPIFADNVRTVNAKRTKKKPTLETCAAHSWHCFTWFLNPESFLFCLLYFRFMIKDCISSIFCIEQLYNES